MHTDLAPISKGLEAKTKQTKEEKKKKKEKRFERVIGGRARRLSFVFFPLSYKVFCSTKEV